MVKKRTAVEVMPKAGMMDDLAAHVDIIHVILMGLLADAVFVDPNVKSRLLHSMRIVRDQAQTIPQLKVAYSRAIDLIESLETQD